MKKIVKTQRRTAMRLHRMLGLAALLSAATLSIAQTFPSKTIHLVSGVSPGSASDTMARIIADKLAASLGQPVIVENKPGASTMLGAEAAAHAPPDGYTLLMATTSTISTNPLLFRKMTYKAADFAPVALTGLTPFVLVAHPSVPAKDAAGLVAYARAHPGKLNFAMLGPGSSTHLVDEMLRSAAQIDIRDVPYKGSGPATTDLLAGHVELNFDAVSTAIARIRSGQLKGLGITSETRSPLLPDVPTFKESGLPQVVAYSWYGLMAPAGTPRPVVERLNHAVNDVLNLPEVKAQMEANGASAPVLDTKQFGDLIEEHTRVWERIVKPLNLQLE